MEQGAVPSAVLTLPSGHTYRVLDDEENAHVARFKPNVGQKRTFVRLDPGNWLYSRGYPALAEKLANFKVRPKDVYVVTFQKAGTTWTQEILWTMLYNPDLDNPDQHLPILERSPFMDIDEAFLTGITPERLKRIEPLLSGFYKHCPDADVKEGPMMQLADASPDPRVLKFHLPISLIPPDALEKSKVVYVARDPRDIVVSMHHHVRFMREFDGTVDDMCSLFTNDEVLNCPYWLHVKEAWQKKDHPNLHFILFEDMKKDIMKELTRINEFLGTNLTRKQLENVREHTSFEAMKKRDNLTAKDKNTSDRFDQEVLQKEGGFFRKGQTGDGKKKLSPESLQNINEWIKKHFDFGLEFN